MQCRLPLPLVISDTSTVSTLTPCFSSISIVLSGPLAITIWLGSSATKLHAKHSLTSVCEGASRISYPFFFNMSIMSYGTCEAYVLAPKVKPRIHAHTLQLIFDLFETASVASDSGGYYASMSVDPHSICSLKHAISSNSP